MQVLRLYGSRHFVAQLVAQLAELSQMSIRGILNCGVHYRKKRVLGLYDDQQQDYL